MALPFARPLSTALSRSLGHKITRSLAQTLGTLALVLNIGVPFASAGDPFRSTEPQPIGEHTEAAFDAMFENGDYATAMEHLEMAQSTEAGEPLVYAMLAAISYLDQDWSQVSAYTRQTLTAAEALQPTSPLRGHLYTAIGHFMEGAYALSPAGEGSLRGVPTALNKLQEVYGSLNAAKAINANDPELNLIQGFMDLQIAVNLPLATPKKAIQRLETTAAPRFLADWGIALAYRDLNQLPDALTRVNAALDNSGNLNPQLYHLRAQVLRKQGEGGNAALFDQARQDFELALTKADQLPKAIAADIGYEYCRNQITIDQVDRDCGAFRQKIRQEPGTWGPASLPSLDGG
ncbi:Sll0314/Alr1548 family TPR repeat-containing protein [Prochlorothrix hollandica]|uniref:Sll0314/Alr1548 family TPR repeat-containing protein n=1 Tax=Prochlorothrix hollandica TaxID=1223 RepID=UPI003342C735